MRDQGASEHMIKSELAQLRTLQAAHDGIAPTVAERREKSKNRDVGSHLEHFQDMEKRRKVRINDQEDDDEA